MNREILFKLISQRLNFLTYLIKQQGKLNLLDINVQCEHFYCDLFNKIFGYSLVNVNTEHRQGNVEGIDLIDIENEICIQISSICTTEKIEHSLSKKILAEYRNYKFYFISLNGENKKMKSKQFENPYQLQFNPSKDIYDVVGVLNVILTMEVGKMEEICNLLQEEITPLSFKNMETSLASLINILSQGIEPDISVSSLNPFEIDRKISYNNLTPIKCVFDEHKLYYEKLNEIYNTFDSQGNSKSTTIFLKLREIYHKNISKFSTDVELLYFIKDEVISFVKKSVNYNDSIPEEELGFYVEIILVDAFIKCKIFKNPEGYNYVATN